jgi:threonine/homoserine/homoserine lactone efflux protein
MEHLGLFLITLLGMILIPGPDLIFVTSRAVSTGRMAAFQSSLGIAAGYLVYTACVALGVELLFKTWPILFDVLKTAGLIYLVYLAYKLFRSTHSPMDSAALAPFANRKNFKQGLITSALNPKGLLFFFSILPQFYVEASLPFWLFACIFGVITSLMCLIVYSTIGITIASMSKKWVASSQQGAVISKATSLVLIALVIIMFLN